ncbi:hypothetical protein [Acinetobacter baumannii]|uniref:hypothetical protein n=1 Tax=Acinetobacter baumannii TaxID=470 RepID=UPI0018FFDB28|nr:hypothetical protein [Acinetobacter baumannii]MBJ9481197.1 hypothetical protein [Acinetobacter baumannii]MBJ9910073.1 hypothetical protein [Acinetobacter baumannii]MBJ9944560.1 hypothetical protein [Acinetobacter baumannii]
MDPFKIKVSDEVSNTKIQEALFELGCEWFGSTNEVKPLANCWIDVGSNGRLTWSFHGSDEKELTLPQLRDLVVLKRNDVKDATHNNFRTNTPYLKQGENEYYMLNEEWVLSNCPNDLEPINKPQDPALISGDVALANVHKCIVQYLHDDEPYGRWTTITDHLWSQYHLGMFLDPDTKFKFRFKPQTIKLQLELPKPFEPKDGEVYYYLKPSNAWGFGCGEWGDDSMQNEYIQYGAWPTKEDVLKVVEQLRKIRGTNS